MTRVIILLCIACFCYVTSCFNDRPWQGKNAMLLELNCLPQWPIPVKVIYSYFGEEAISGRSVYLYVRMCFIHVKFKIAFSAMFQKRWHILFCTKERATSLNFTAFTTGLCDVATDNVWI